MSPTTTSKDGRSREEQAFEASKSALVYAQQSLNDRREATVKAARFSNVLGGLSSNQAYQKSLQRRATLAAIDLKVMASDEVVQTVQTAQDYTQGAQDGATVIYGTITGIEDLKGTVSLIGPEGEITQSDISTLQMYRLITTCPKGEAKITIHDQQGNLILEDGRQIDLAKTTTLERNFAINRCGQMGAVDDDTVEEQPIIRMPDLQGMQREQALKTLQEIGKFKVKQSETADASPKNSVIGQTPAADTTILPEQVIEILLSKGVEKVAKMPDLSGLTQEEVRKRLSNLTFKSLSFDFEFKPQMDRLVTKQSPLPDADLKPESTISICIGRAERIMPKVVGMSIAGAKETLIPDITKTIKEELAHAPEEAGTVVAQSPAPDARLAEGTEIKLTVSQGPKKPTDNTNKLRMPDLKGKTLDQALAALKEVGVTDPTINRTTANRPGSVVLEQDLSAETLLRSGQKVTLKFGKPR